MEFTQMGHEIQHPVCELRSCALASRLRVRVFGGVFVDETRVEQEMEEKREHIEGRETRGETGEKGRDG